MKEALQRKTRTRQTKCERDIIKTAQDIKRYSPAIARRALNTNPAKMDRLDGQSYCSFYTERTYCERVGEAIVPRGTSASPRHIDMPSYKGDLSLTCMNLRG